MECKCGGEFYTYEYLYEYNTLVIKKRCAKCKKRIIEYYSTQLIEREVEDEE